MNMYDLLDRISETPINSEFSKVMKNLVESEGFLFEIIKETKYSQVVGIGLQSMRISPISVVSLKMMLTYDNNFSNVTIAIKVSDKPPHIVNVKLFSADPITMYNAIGKYLSDFRDSWSIK